MCYFKFSISDENTPHGFPMEILALKNLKLLYMKNHVSANLLSLFDLC